MHCQSCMLGCMCPDSLPLTSSAFPPSSAADQLPAALRLSEEQWQQQYRFPKPRPHDPVVMQCRTNRRAAWAAQLAQDSGLHNCLVYRQVTTACQCRELPAGTGKLLPPRSEQNMVFGPRRTRFCTSCSLSRLVTCRETCP